jgi:hypothetical protein
MDHMLESRSAVQRTEASPANLAALSEVG